ncbi:MAG: hypoxanthine phosphoribosyltransferase [Deltaproteobacteria bacterium]
MITEIRGRKLKLLLSSSEISKRVSELGGEITADYENKDPLLICVLKGGFIFLADLVRNLDFNVQIDFIRISSYREGMEPGDIELVTDATMPVEGRHVLLVEDLLDTGITMNFIKETLLARNPASLKICALINKKERREVEVKADYLGFSIENGFIIGYGTDWGETGRNLRDIYLVE